MSSLLKALEKKGITNINELPKNILIHINRYESLSKKKLPTMFDENGQLKQKFKDELIALAETALTMTEIWIREKNKKTPEPNSNSKKEYTQPEPKKPEPESKKGFMEWLFS